MFGHWREGGDWEAMLKERATVSAVKAKKHFVPAMTLREYERWK